MYGFPKCEEMLAPVHRLHGVGVRLIQFGFQILDVSKKLVGNGSQLLAKAAGVASRDLPYLLSQVFKEVHHFQGGIWRHHSAEG